MVLQIMRWNILPDHIKTLQETYGPWSHSAIKRILSTGLVQEFRAYRPASGAHQVVVTHEFANFAAYAAFMENEDIQNLLNEMRAYVSDIEMEIWGPSPVVPQPLRPEQ